MAKNIWGKRCDRCGKGIAYLMNVSHSHIRTNSKSLPNLHKTTLTIGGETRQFRFCTKCLRIMKSGFSKVQGQANKIVKEAQKVEAPVVVEPKVETPSSVVEETPAPIDVAEEEPKKAKKAAKPKAKAKETSRKKALTDLISDEDEAI